MATKYAQCRLCHGHGVLGADECPDCDGDGSVLVGSTMHAQQLKLARNKVKAVKGGCSYCGKPADTVACGIGGCPLGADL